MHLRVTRRAIQDLDLDVEDCCGRAAEMLIDKHVVIAAFVDQRSQTPEGQETTRLPSTRAVVWNLHAGRYRALTWHDTECSTVWLLGAGWHEQGSIDDAYAVLKQRDTTGGLFPTEQDFLDFEPSPVQFVETLFLKAPQLLERAREESSTPVSDNLGDMLAVRIYVDEDDGMRVVTVALGMPPLVPGVLPPNWQMTAAAAFAQNVPFEEIDWTPRRRDDAGAGSNRGDVFISWIEEID